MNPVFSKIRNSRKPLLSNRFHDGLSGISPVKTPVPAAWSWRKNIAEAGPHRPAADISGNAGRYLLDERILSFVPFV